MNFNSFPYKWLVAVAFVMALFMDIMDTTIVNVALPTLAQNLHANNTSLEWVVNAYLLSLAIWIPASGWLGDRYGTKKTFLFAIFVFTLGSALCGFAWNASSLIFFRVLQGIGGGMMTPVGTAMLFRAFPPYERAQASSIMTVPIAFSPALGPVLGGWLVDFVGWRWIFYVNIPIGIAAFLFSLKFLREHTEKNAGNFDLAGFLLSGFGLVFLLYALSLEPLKGWTNPEIVFSGILGIVLLTILVKVEQRNKYPLLHFGLFNERLFRTTNIVMFFAFAVWLGFLFVLPLFLQELRGLSALNSGLTTFPQAIGWLVISLIAARFYPKLGPKKMITWGLVGAMIFTFVFVFINTDTNLWIFRLIMFFRGITMGFAIIPIQAATFTNIPSEESGRASSFFNTNRQVASSFGVALLGTILFQLLGTQMSLPTQLFAYHMTFIVATVFGSIAILFALTIKDEDAAASMVKIVDNPVAE